MAAPEVSNIEQFHSTARHTITSLTEPVAWAGLAIGEN